MFEHIFRPQGAPDTHTGGMDIWPLAAQFHNEC